MIIRRPHPGFLEEQAQIIHLLNEAPGPFAGVILPVGVLAHEANKTDKDHVPFTDREWGFAHMEQPLQLLVRPRATHGYFDVSLFRKSLGLPNKVSQAGLPQSHLLHEDAIPVTDQDAAPMLDQNIKTDFYGMQCQAKSYESRNSIHKKTGKTRNTTTKVQMCHKKTTSIYINIKKYSLIIIILLASCASGCSLSASKAARHLLADKIAAEVNMRAIEFHLQDEPYIRLKGYTRNNAGINNGSVLTVYIEGDGLAYIRKNTLSNDPTPINPMGLRLAAVDPSPAILYLSRPCQYITDRETNACDPRHWTTARYSSQIVSWYNAVLDLAKIRFNADQLRLVGYSGGGSLVVLLAGSRRDVTALVTIAGNLDTEAWTELHGVSGLADSLNPITITDSVANIPQIHYVGTRDSITPPALCQRFLAKMPPRAPAKCQFIEGAGHHEGLLAAWAKLCQQTLTHLHN